MPKTIRILQKEIDKETLFHYDIKKEVLQKDVYRAGYFQAYDSRNYHSYNVRQWEALLNSIYESQTIEILYER